MVVQHLSRLRLRRPVAPLLVLVRAQPRLDAHLLQAARDRGLPAARRRGLRHRALRAARHDRDRRRLGRGRAALARRDRPAARVSARVLVSAAGALSDPQHARDRGPRPLRGRACSTPRSGTTTYDVDRQARGRHRHRRLGDPVRARRSRPKVEQMHVFQRTAPWIMPHTDRPISRARAPPLPPLPAAAAARPRRHLLRPRAARARLRQAAAADEARRAARRAGTWTARSPTPSCAARSSPATRSAASGSCRRTRGIRRSAATNVELVTDGVAEVRERSIVTGARRASTRSTRSSSAPAST